MKQQMTQTEHLKLIRARCVELLEIAEKRTAGECWYFADPTDSHTIVSENPPSRESGIASVTSVPFGHPRFNECIYNATFIASCAGAAEAGWLATIAAIDAFSKLDGVTYGWDGDCGATCIADIMADSITSAWPIELLNNK